jgi:hypothetical protein
VSLKQHIFSAPFCGDRLGHKVISGLRPVALDMTLAGRKIRAEIGKYLSEAGQIQLGQIECAETPLDVIEAMAEPVQGPRRKFERACVVADSPQEILTAADAHA